LTTAASIEMQAQCGAAGPLARTLSWNAPTQSANAQVEYIVGAGFPYADIEADGRNLRFADALVRNVPYWLEAWDTDNNPTSNIWLRPQDLGTDEVTMHYGTPGLGPVS